MADKRLVTPLFRLEGAINSALGSQGGVGDEIEARCFALEVDGFPDGEHLLIDRTVRLERDLPKFPHETVGFPMQGEVEEVGFPVAVGFLIEAH